MRENKCLPTQNYINDHRCEKTKVGYQLKITEYIMDFLQKQISLQKSEYLIDHRNERMAAKSKIFVTVT